MNRSSIGKATVWLRALTARRPRRASWAYILWLFAWLPPMVWLAGNLSFEVRPRQLLKVVIPVVVVLAQLAYPTLLGWAVVLIPSVFFAGVMVLAVALTAPGRVESDLIGLAISSVAAGVYVIVCVALWFARPMAVLAAPNVSAHAGPADPAGNSNG